MPIPSRARPRRSSIRAATRSRILPDAAVDFCAKSLPILNIRLIARVSALGGTTP